MGDTMDDTTTDLQLAAAGDQEAFARFYDLTAAKAYLLARLATTSEAAAQEVTKLAYVDAWTNAATQHCTSLSAETWLLTMVRQRARESREQKSRARIRLGVRAAALITSLGDRTRLQ